MLVLTSYLMYQTILLSPLSYHSKNICLCNRKESLPSLEILRLLVAFYDTKLVMLDASVFLPLAKNNDSDIDHILLNLPSLSIGILNTGFNTSINKILAAITNTLKNNLPRWTFDVDVIYDDIPEINVPHESLQNQQNFGDLKKHCSHLVVHHRATQVTVDIVIVTEKDELWYTGSIVGSNCSQCDRIGALTLPFAKARLFSKMDVINRTIFQNITVWIPDPEKYSYVEDFQNSEFIECDYNRTATFMAKYPYKITRENAKHLVRILLYFG